jgi:RNA polymerase sigma-70 factor (ECF subfamily)
MSEALHHAIQTLHPNYRAIILLRDIEELSTEESAEVLELSIDVVKQRLHRARVALRKALDEQLQTQASDVVLSGKP